MWKALDNLWLTRAGTAVFLAGAIQTFVRWLMGLSLNVVGVVLFAVGIVLILGPRLSKHFKGDAIGAGSKLRPSAAIPEPVFGAVEGEIALAHEEAAELGKLLGGEWPHLTPEGAALEEAIADWRAKTGVFIEVALGSAHRAAFRTAARGDALDCIEAEAKCLSDLGQRLKPSMVRVDQERFLQARKTRRENKAARYLSHEHHRAPYAPPPALEAPPSQFSRRDDRGELAQRCHMLAGSVERWVEGFKRGHSERAEKFVAEWLEAEPATDPAEARRKALTRDEKNWEVDYRLKYQREAAKRFKEAWELGEVAKEHEQLATAPLAIQFEEVPKLFNTIADRLYGDG